MISRRRFIGTLGGSALVPTGVLGTEHLPTTPVSRSGQSTNPQSGGNAPKPMPAQDVGKLPAWSPPTTAPTESFKFDASPEKLQGGHWRVPGIPRRYFQELLPATFERTLVMDQLEAKQAASPSPHPTEGFTYFSATTILLGSAIWKSPSDIPSGPPSNPPPHFKVIFVPSPYASIRD